MSMKAKKTLTAWSASVFALAGIATIFVSGCPVTPTDGNGGGGEPGSGRGVTVELVSPTTGFGISVLDADPITVIYTIGGEPDEIRGYYIPVAGKEPTSEPTGDPVIVNGDLQAGTNQFFSFIPADAGVGMFRVGVIAIVGNTQILRESAGVIEVEDHPHPSFLEPDQDLTVVEQGGSVTVRFDAGDPQSSVRWRLFYLAPGASTTTTPDQLGTTLGQPGSGNIGQFTWDLGTLPPGDYRLGLAATDSGFTISQTVTRGLSDRIFTIPSDETSTPVIRIVAPATSTPPTLAFTAPGNDDIDLFGDESFTIRFDGDIRVPDATGTIDIFYDTDRSTANGVELIADDVAASSTTAEFPDDLAEGTYNVGGTIRDNINQPVTVYAKGQVIVSRTLSIDVLTPSTSATLRPGDPVEITWTAKGPAGRGTFDVLAQRLNADGTPRGGLISVAPNLPRTRTSATFTTDTSGLYEFKVVLELADGTSVEDKAPAKIRFSSLPEIIWTGSLANKTGPHQGAVFGGVNFEDNAGTTLSPAGDLDGNGIGEFIIGARYGKTLFINPSSIGPGEAYIIYGRSGGNKIRGEFNLNTVGQPALRGVTLYGVLEFNGVTDGISDIALLPDMDGDGRGELAFGMPRSSSPGHLFTQDIREGFVALPDQLLRGGVIILSSNNSLLADPSLFVFPTLDLDLVGYEFSDETPSGGMVLNDLKQFDDAEDGPMICPQDSGTDNWYDTITIDVDGFNCTLANQTSFPVYLDDTVRNSENANYTFISDSSAEATEECHSDFTPPGICDCPDVMFPPTSFSDLQSFVSSRTYPIDATISEPRGARLIGPELDSRLGTSISISQISANASGFFDIIITAPAMDGIARVDGFQPIGDAGIAYLVPGHSYWSGQVVNSLPGPYQYNVGAASRCNTFFARLPTDLTSRPAHPDFVTMIAGNPGDKIENIEGIEDFNGDLRNDIGVGAPNASQKRGRLSVVYRRDPTLEGDFLLSKLSLPRDDLARLDGFQVITDSDDPTQNNAQLGSSMASGFDFDRDGISDLAVSMPGAGGGSGWVLILFSARELVSPANGFTVNDLLATRRQSDGGPVAALIKGNPLDTSGAFGFNITNGGDLDGDGFDELVIAAPGATPRFDSDPTDGNDVLDSVGVDVNGDGVADPVPGGADMTAAGLVYVIYGKNLLDSLTTCSASATVCTSDGDCPEGETCGGDMIINIDQLGSSQLAGFMLAGRKTGDRLGGGDAGDTTQGGITQKVGRGRSRGLSTAGDVDGDGRDDLLIGSVLADPRPNIEPPGLTNAGEVYLFYGASAPK